MSTVSDGQVVIIHYTLKNDQGETLDSSVGSDPLPYLHGAGNIVVGLENALIGKSVGDSVDIVVSPEEGYGLRDPAGVQDVPRDAFPEDAELEDGSQFMMHDDDGQAIPVWVIAVGSDTVTLDANHPLAGQALHFSVTIESTRAPTDDEKTHGHPHGLAGTEGHH
jgi:FKBP-type peptidyl-prolyl cis-trans isomerase SlyD